jgi:hypothetical protein
MDLPKYGQLALEILNVRLRVYKPESPPVGGAYFIIGTGYLKAGMLEVAEEATQQSLDICDFAGDRHEATLYREQLGMIYEEQDRFADAKEIRLRSASERKISCTSTVVSRWEVNAECLS